MTIQPTQSIYDELRDAKWSIKTKFDEILLILNKPNSKPEIKSFSNLSDITFYTNGRMELHRLDGPAFRLFYSPKRSPSNVIDLYCINGIAYSPVDYWKEIHKKGLISEEELFKVLL